MAEMVSDDNVVRLTATSRLTCGMFAVVPDGRVGVVQNMDPVEIGEVATVKIRGICKALAAANMDAGDTVAAHIANQTIVATGGDGVDLGKLLYDVSTNGYAEVDMNP